MNNQSRKNSFAASMGMALVGGIAAGFSFLFLKEYLMSTGRSEAWEFIYMLLFQNITATGAENAIGIFYIIGQLFVKSLQVIIVPMVFTSIALAMQQIRDMKVMKRISLKTIQWFMMCYGIALILACMIGMFCTKLGVFATSINNIEETMGSIASNPLETVLNIVPSNMIEALSGNNTILSVVFLAVACGLAMNYLGREKTETVTKMLEEVNAIVLVLLNFVIRKVGPLGTFVLLTTAFATYGTEYLLASIAYLVAAAVTLLLFLFLGYPLLVWVGTGLNPVIFMKKIMEVMIFAFSTTSSAAVLPLNIEVNIKKLGVSEEVASFVLPLGMTINMNGTAIMQVIATLFIASCSGYEVTFASLLLLGALTLITSAGTPATSGAGGIILFTILSGMGYVNGSAMLAYTLILAINKPIGMLVTAINVVGDATACLYVGKSEGNLDVDVYNNVDV